MVNKVTHPAKIVTDSVMLTELTRQGIDKDYVEFFKDYSPRYPQVKLYRDLKSNKQFAVISVSPRVSKDGKKIVARWKKSPDGTYHADNNTFSASVEGKRVNVGVDGKTASWAPQLFLNGSEIACNPEPTLLGVDLTNGNYSNNVLEWDYGPCKRRLRLIEGAILEAYVFDHHPDYKREMIVRGECNRCGECDLGCQYQNPDGTCSVYDKRQEMSLLDCIKYPDVDDLLANTAPPECSYWIEYEDEKFQPRDVDLTIKSNMQGEVSFAKTYCTEGVLQVAGDEKRFSFKWTINGKPRVWHYPLIIDDTLTVYSISSDGDITSIQSDTYATVHNAADGQYILDTTTDAAASNFCYIRSSVYEIRRGFLYFVTSGLGAAATIAAATLSLYTQTTPRENDDGQAVLHIVEGVQDDPLELNDYGDHLTKTTSGGSIDHAAIILDQYNDIILNATGRGWINKTGTTKFCLRVSGDKDNSTPTEQNYVYWDTDEAGNGRQPKLVVTGTGFAFPDAWSGKISGVTNPAKVMGVPVANIAKVKGVA